MSELRLVLNTKPSAPSEVESDMDISNDDSDIVFVYHGNNVNEPALTNENNKSKQKPNQNDNNNINVNESKINQNSSNNINITDEIKYDNNNNSNNNINNNDNYNDNYSDYNINNNNDDIKVFAKASAPEMDNKDEIKLDDDSQGIKNKSYFDRDLQFPQTVTYKNAGICIYRQKSNEKGIQFMMGIEKSNNYLSFFGGKRDENDKNAVHTALREFDDETSQILDETILEQMKQMLTSSQERQLYWKDQWHSVLYFYNMGYDYDLVKNFAKKRKRTCDMKSLHWIDFDDIYKSLLIDGEPIQINRNIKAKCRGFIYGVFLDKNTREYFTKLHAKNGGVLLNPAKYGKIRPIMNFGKEIPRGIRFSCINPITKCHMFYRWINVNIEDVDSLQYMQILIHSVFPEFQMNFMLCRSVKNKRIIVDSDTKFDKLKTMITKRNVHIIRLMVMPTIVGTDFELTFNKPKMGINNNESSSDNDEKQNSYFGELVNGLKKFNPFGYINNNNNNNNNKKYSFKWQYQNDESTFTDLTEHVSNKIEGAFVAGTKQVHYNSFGEFYIANFITMQQCNQKTKKQRLLRRVPLYTISTYDKNRSSMNNNNYYHQPNIQSVLDYNQWQYEENDHSWKDFETKHSKILNKFQQHYNNMGYISNYYGEFSNQCTKTIKVNNTKYSVDIHHMKQKNLESTKVRNVRIVPVYKNIDVSSKWKWQWKDDGFNKWKDYDNVISKQIENEYNALHYRKFKIHVDIYTEYTIDLLTMKQKNNKTKKLRDIRRVDVNDSSNIDMKNIQFKWEWKNDSNNFVAFDAQTSIKIEQAYLNKWNKYQYNVNNKSYEIKFADMVQYNILTGNKRELRRIKLNPYINWCGPKKRNTFSNKCLELYTIVGENIAKEIKKYNKFVRCNVGSFGEGIYFNQSPLQCKKLSLNKSNDNKGYLIKCKVNIGNCKQINDINAGTFNFIKMQNTGKYDSIFYKSLINGYQYIVFSFDQIKVIHVQKYD